MTRNRQQRRPLTGLTRAASRALGVERVFGAPITAGGTTLVPVATVFGGHGLGYGFGEGEQPGDPRPTGPESEPVRTTGADLSMLPAGEDGPIAVVDVLPTSPGAPVGAATDLDPETGRGAEAARTASGGSGEAGGGAFLAFGWPAGAYVVTEQETRWRPAVDTNVLILAGAGLVSCALTALATVAIAKAGSRSCMAFSAAGAQAVAAVSDAAAETLGTFSISMRDGVSSVADSFSTAFSGATHAAAGAAETFATKATEAFVAGAEAARAATVGMWEHGARAVTETVSTTADAVTSSIRKRA